MTGIDEYRQVAQTLDRQHRAQVKGIAGIGLKGADAPLAQDDIFVALGQDVFGGHEEFLDRGAHAALQQHGLAGLSHRFEQIEILHVAGADLDHIHFRHEPVQHRHGHDFANDRQAGDGPGELQQLQPFFLEALETVRRAAGFERAAPQESRAGRLDFPGDFHDLLLAFHRTGPRHHRQLIGADQAIRDPHHGVFRVKQPIRFFVRLRYRHHFFHAALAPQLFRIDFPGVADHAENGAAAFLRRACAAAGLLDFLSHRRDLFPRRR